MFVKKAIKRVIPEYILKSIKIFYVLSKKYGHRKSIALKKCIDGNGNEIPWYTYPTIEYLSGLDFSSLDILEYGAGSSSLWWSGRAKSVLAIEHNSNWYESIKNTEKENLSIVYAGSEQEYVLAGSGSQFDVIVIDGIHRLKCVEQVPLMLSDAGLVILDNSDWHPEAALFLRETMELIQVDFHGFGPINEYTWTTSLFFSRKFRCVPLGLRMPEYSAGAIKKLAS